MPASSRATASPANEAPQINTSASRLSGVRSAPRLVARFGMGSGGFYGEVRVVAGAGWDRMHRLR